MQTNNFKQSILNITLILYTISIIFDLHFFYNSITTLIRMTIISILFLILFFKYATKKEKKIIFSYFIVVIIYTILHLLNCSNFNISITTHYNNLEEILYIWKMISNILIIYIVYKLNINLNNFINPLKISLWFISGSILLCNIFKLGYETYDFEPIAKSIFNWNQNSLSFEQVSSKGFFHLANQIIAIILLYIPLLLNEIKLKWQIRDVFLLLITLISSIIVGNRLSTLGPLIILVVSFLIYIFLCIIKKEKFEIRFFAVILSSLIIYNIFVYNSPLLKRIDYYENLNNNTIKIERENSTNDENTKEIVSLDELIDNKRLNINFIKVYYPYENDPYFWDEILEKNNNLSDSRKIEIRIISHIKDLNNKKTDDYFGIGYNRIINIFNIEKDYIMQYYSIGIIGLILFLGTYFMIYIYAIYKLFINMEAKFTFSNLMLLLGTGIFLLSAYFSGNILNAISTIIPISFTLGVLLNEINKKICKSEKVLGFKICTNNKYKILNDLESDLINNKRNIIYNINPLIIINFYQNPLVVKKFNQEKYNIPDGIGTIIASKIKDGPLMERITGIDLFLDICSMSSKINKTIFLYGSKPGIAEKTKEVLYRRFPNIKIVETLNGYVKPSEALKQIKKANPDILFVALGSPKQEEFIIKNDKELKKVSLIMPIGGSMDVVSGMLKPAPNKYKKYNLEWLYRMLQEPKRLKQIIKLIKFLTLVIFRNNWYNKKCEDEQYEKYNCKLKKI